MLTTRNTQTWLPEMLNEMFDNNWMVTTHKTEPSVNVKESKENYTVEVAAPGMSKENFSISLENEQLVIAMDKKEESSKEGSRYLRREFNYSNYKQAFLLPDDVMVDKISAKMENGILTIELPKRQEVIERQKDRSIAIK